MEWKDFGLSWRREHCPFVVWQSSPGLPKPPVLSELSNVRWDCGTPITCLQDAQTPSSIGWVMAPIPRRWSSGAWWLNILRVSEVTARMIAVALSAEDWNGNLLVGIVANPTWRFSDGKSLWRAATNGTIWWKNGLTTLASKHPRLENWEGHCADLLSAPNNLLEPIGDLSQWSLTLPLPDHTPPPCWSE